MNLTVGTKVKYIGDMANLPGYGEIAKVAPCDWYGQKITVRLDAQPCEIEEYSVPEREFILTPNSFKPGPGTRFFIVGAPITYSLPGMRVGDVVR